MFLLLLSVLIMKVIIFHLLDYTNDKKKLPSSLCVFISKPGDRHNSYKEDFLSLISYHQEFSMDKLYGIRCSNLLIIKWTVKKKNDFIRNFALISSTVRFNLNEESSIQAFFSSDAI